MRVEGKTIVVTGAAAGIGRALTEKFVAEGAKAVIGADISPALSTVCDQTGAHPIETDVGREDSTIALIEEAENDTSGPLTRVVPPGLNAPPNVTDALPLRSTKLPFAADVRDVAVSAPPG